MRYVLTVLVVLPLAACAVPAPRAVDVNVATEAELRTLPGVASEDARRIEEGRPYFDKQELLRRGVVDGETYAALADRVVVGPPATPEWLGWVPRMPQSP